MKLKNTLFLLLVIAFVVAVAGCSSDNNGSGVQQVKTSSDPQTAPQTQATPVATPDVKGSLKNPASISDIVTVESTGNTYDFSIVKYLRGTEADNKIHMANEFNEKPPTGYEYLLVDVKAAYTKGENSVYMSNLLFKAYADNVECKNSFAVLPKDYISFDGGNVMPSGTKEGWVAYIVPQGKEVIVGFQPNMIEGSTGYITLGSK
jgi:Domain of unknown function (DUF4352)